MNDYPNRRPAQPNVAPVQPTETVEQKEIIAQLSQLEADKLKEQTRHSGENVAEHTKQVAGAVKEETVTQAKDLAGQIREDLQQYVGPQQQKIAATVRTISDEIDAISRGEKPQSDYITGFLGQASGYVNSVATSLEQKQPQEILTDVRRFASRRPGLFLAAALGVGILAGRATRNLGENDQVPSSTEEVKEYLKGNQQSAPFDQEQAQGQQAYATTPQDPTSHGQHNDLTAHNIPGAGFTAEEGNRR